MDINIIELNGNLYGLPTVSVLEVLDPVEVTPLPFVPAYVDGLVNIGGSVIVQLDLSVQLEHAAPIEYGLGQLVVIESGGEKIALHIDRALLMVNVAEEDIDSAPVDNTTDGMALNMLAGQFQWRGKTVLNLALEQLELKMLEQSQGVVCGEGLVAAELTISNDKSKNAEDALLAGYLVVVCGGEHYALPMEHVCSVEDLHELTALPQAPTEVVGLIYSLQVPLLVLGLGLLLGQGADAGQKLVVVQHENFRCALKVDHIKGIRRLALRDNHDMLGKEGQLNGYLLGDDDQLIGVLNLDVLFCPERRDSLKRFMVDDNRRTVETERIAMRSLLTFQVGAEQCALPLSLVERIVEYQQVESLPEGGAENLHGAVQIHGDILPVVDLRLLMGVVQETTPLTAYVVAGEEENRWALVVDQVDRVLDVPETDLEPAGSREQQYMEAIARIDNGLVTVVNLTKLTRASATVPPVYNAPENRAPKNHDPREKGQLAFDAAVGCAE